MTRARNNGLRSFARARAEFARGVDTPSAFLDRCLDAMAKRENEIGAFVHVNESGAREAAAAATKRWREGKPLSHIDGMPVGIKDIAETIDMPTEMGSPLYKGWRSGRDAASVAALREAGAVIVGKTVTTEFAATKPAATRNPHDLKRTPGGSSSGSAAGVAAGMIAAGLGTQVMGSIVRPASFCGCYGFKPSLGGINRGGSHDGLSQSVHGALAASLEDAWDFCWAIVARVGGDPDWPGIAGPEARPESQRPRTLALIETPGWELATPGAKAALDGAAARLSAAGVAIVDRKSDPLVDMIETELREARALSERANAWESRWPLNTYRAKNAGGLSRFMLDRLDMAERMHIEDYRRTLAERARIRSVYARLADLADAVVTLAATSAAPLGLESTGNPIFAIPGSMLGVPAVSLPVLEDEGLPLGLQLMGFEQQDAALIGIARWADELFEKHG